VAVLKCSPRSNLNRPLPQPRSRRCGCGVGLAICGKWCQLFRNPRTTASAAARWSVPLRASLYSGIPCPCRAADLRIFRTVIRLVRRPLSLAALGCAQHVLPAGRPLRALVRALSPRAWTQSITRQARAAHPRHGFRNRALVHSRSLAARGSVQPALSR
jgi:hypothetical protein